MEIKLSVIIPCYNQGHFVHEAIDSVLESDKNSICEIIIINDGSTNRNTNDILSKINHERILVHTQENQGLAKARNKGVELAKSNYLLMLDADNKITADFLEIFEDFIKKGIEFDALHGNSMFFGEIYDQEKYVYHSQPLNLFKISKGNYIDACAIVKKSTLIELGMYDHLMPHMGLEDWDLWIRMALKGKTVVYHDKVLFHYRYSTDSMIRTYNKENDHETREYLVKKYNNVMFRDGFLDENPPFTNFDEMKSTKVLKELLKRVFRKVKR